MWWSDSRSSSQSIPAFQSLPFCARKWKLVKENESSWTRRTLGRTLKNDLSLSKFVANCLVKRGNCLYMNIIYNSHIIRHLSLHSQTHTDTYRHHVVETHTTHVHQVHTAPEITPRYDHSWVFKMQRHTKFLFLCKFAKEQKMNQMLTSMTTFYAFIFEKGRKMN